VDLNTAMVITFPDWTGVPIVRLCGKPCSMVPSWEAAALRLGLDPQQIVLAYMRAESGTKWHPPRLGSSGDRAQMDYDIFR
jgi:hypothetical protein